MDKKQQYKCFVAMPIGSKEKVFPDWQKFHEKEKTEFEHWRYVYDNIILDAMDSSGIPIDCWRADRHCEPGEIADDIIEHLLNDDIAIFDISLLNPNVFWELGIRHCFHNRNIIITSDKGNPPFDIFGQRALKYDVKDLDILKEFKSAMHASIKDLIDQPNKLRNGVQKYIGTHQVKTEIKSDKEKTESIDEGLKSFNKRIENLLCVMDFQPFPTHDDYTYFSENINQKR